MHKKILITGAAGFIGFHLTQRLAAHGLEILGLDSLSDYYDPALKSARLDALKELPGFRFQKLDIADREAVFATLAENKDITHVVHLAAQAGVRYSLIDPYSYVSANVAGQVVLLEAARTILPSLQHFVYASSSSVYGANSKLPYAITDPVDAPVSLYAASKRSGELIASTYAHLYRVPATGLRFFTVYGPWGRPDMAYYSFTKAIFEGAPIKLFNHGQMQRDFTYIDDIVDGILAVLDRPPEDPGASGRPHRLFNLGNNHPEKLLDFVATLERLCGRKAVTEMHPMQPGDVQATYADIMQSQEILGFTPKVRIEEGLARFVAWYQSYHRVWPKN